MMTLSQIANYFVALLVVCSPLSAFPALLKLTQEQTLEEKQRTGIVASIAAGSILIFVTWMGIPFLAFFGIRVHAFQIAGGIIIFLLALSMLNAEGSKMQHSPEEKREVLDKKAIAIVPLAIPLIAGPGAISTVIVQATAHPGIANQIFMTIIAAFVALILGIVLYLAGPLERMLGRVGINIFNRVGGLILAAIAVESIAKGLEGLFPYLTKGL